MTEACVLIVRTAVDESSKAQELLLEHELTKVEFNLCTAILQVQTNKANAQTIAALDELKGDSDDQVVAWCNCALARLHSISAKREAAEFACNEAVNFGRKCKDVFVEAWANRIMAVVRHGQARYTEALAFYKQAHDNYQAVKDNAGVARVTGNMGVIYQYLTNYPMALQHFREALTVHKEMGNLTAEARTTGNMGNIYLNLAEYPAALEHYQDALKLYSQVHDVMGKATVTANIGIVYTSLADPKRALAFYERALELHQSAHDVLGSIRTETLLASAYSALANYPKALEYSTEARDAAKKCGARDLEVHAAMAEARAHSLQGEYEVALTLLLDAKSIAKEIGSAGIELAVLIATAEINKRAGNVTESLDGFTQAQLLANSTGKKGDEAECHRSLCELFEREQDWENAFRNNVRYHELKSEISGEEQQRRLAVMEAEIKYEAERSASKRERDLLTSILPQGTVQRILAGEEVIADRYEGVAIMFADIAGFTEAATTMSPDHLIEMLNNVFTACDAIMKRHGCVKVKTIGDAYMAIAGAPELVSDPANRLCRAALDMAGLTQTNFRIGIHFGDVVAGVIGRQKAAWDVWGDTVNVASRLESSGESHQVQVSSDVVAALTSEGFIVNYMVTERGTVLLKGKGLHTTYWLQKA